METIHRLPNGEQINIRQSLDNMPPKWILDYVLTEQYAWSHVDGLDVLHGMCSAKVWNQITYRFKNLATPSEIWGIIKFSHTLIDSKALCEDRKLLLFKLFWHTKLDDFPKKWSGDYGL